MSGKILVLGASGRVGGRLSTLLSGRGEQVRAATRRPSLMQGEAVELDLERPETFAPALEGVDRAFLIARPGDEQADAVAIPLIEEMRRADVRRVVNLTAMGVERMEGSALRRIELALEASGIAFTHLRPNWFMQVFASPPLLPGILATGAIHLPAGDARISYIDARDIAEVAAAALMDPGHENRAYTLTGPEALDHHEVARAIGSASGRPVRYVPITEEAAREALAGSGLPPVNVERLVGFYRLVRQGLCAPVTEAVPEILGRPALSIERFASDHSRAWSPPPACKDGNPR